MSKLHFLMFLLPLCPSILAAAAPPPPTIPSLTLSNSDALNLTFPKNPTLPSQPRLGDLPPDPLYSPIPDTILTLVFRNYTVPINHLSATRCVEAALGDILTHGDRIYSEIRVPRDYAWGAVELMLVPGRTMRWVEWSYAVKTIHMWLMEYDCVDLNFDVVVNGAGIVGTGRLANVI
ncbi:MAG: hypothetical protein ALECFALPRED_005806 [Alectoria fallacina]|uniref:Uncharacterized protein n=1 Tax=Alectoria fallacina TaxID=1903189 RepID=A0A8H3FXC3_9LECA|nr:MAG: hypothetical protein ALECFALPRED_005806 [Alectoria fallacina]